MVGREGRGRPVRSYVEAFFFVDVESTIGR